MRSEIASALVDADDPDWLTAYKVADVTIATLTRPDSVLSRWFPPGLVSVAALLPGMGKGRGTRPQKAKGTGRQAIARNRPLHPAKRGHTLLTSRSAV